LTADLNQKTTPYAIVGTEFTRIDGENDRVTHSTWGAHAGAGIRHMIGAKVAIRAEGRVQLSHYNEVPMDQHTVYSPMGTLGLSYFTRGRTAPEVVIVAAPASPQPFRIDTFYSVRVDTVRDVRVETVYRDVPSAPSSSSSDQVVLRVQFRTGGAELLPGSRTVLNTVAAAIKETPDSRWQVEGHTDGVGSDAANKKLSQARAQAVVDYLVSRGVQSGALSAVGYGEERQVFSNSTAEGRAENRRVQLRRLPPPPTEPIR
jgi:outer membrane protein OmpA-like peptidoglycan-associated protein